ncbi:hypothetical protein FSBG_00133 [Fusobacterium gonidiaformans 3-1-5R]|uniref:Uncharacterized protein n=1 Tax=Fusobacterium gonidiaformans 3-1-5R TaxID=469605 RepID=E5BEV5_9FUSO|nr:hypothetical protein [Fusobacterium gonidiaformans]EFS20636.1 hypothetical protein FSBG_00133 [Fusobacterium gonidiaformans 3-1-5R]
MELLEAIRKNNEKLQEQNESIRKECEELRVKAELLTSLLHIVPTKLLCEELKRRCGQDFIEVERTEKIFISTKKGITETSSKDIILMLRKEDIKF